MVAQRWALSMLDIAANVLEHDVLKLDDDTRRAVLKGPEHGAHSWTSCRIDRPSKYALRALIRAKLAEQAGADHCPLRTGRRGGHARAPDRRAIHHRVSSAVLCRESRWRRRDDRRRSRSCGRARWLHAGGNRYRLEH